MACASLDATLCFKFVTLRDVADMLTRHMLVVVVHALTIVGHISKRTPRYVISLTGSPIQGAKIPSVTGMLRHRVCYAVPSVLMVIILMIATVWMLLVMKWEERSRR